MRVSKWVDFGQEVDIEIDFRDVQAAMGEAFQRATEARLDETPNRNDISRALSMVGTFLKALADEHIAALSPAARKIVSDFLLLHAARFTDSREQEPLVGTHTESPSGVEAQTQEGEKGSKS